MLHCCPLCTASDAFSLIHADAPQFGSTYGTSFRLINLLGFVRQLLQRLNLTQQQEINNCNKHDATI
jgi:hypothetical protein